MNFMANPTMKIRIALRYLDVVSLLSADSRQRTLPHRLTNTMMFMVELPD